MTSLQSFAKGTLASAVGLSTLSLGLLYYGQNYLIYPSAFPPGSRTVVPTPADHGLPYEDLTLDTSDGIRIKCYVLVQRRDLPGQTPSEETISEDVDMAEEDRKFASTRPTILMFHGNGGNIGHRVPLARIFYSKMRCNVILVSYRGYGLSEGSPNEAGFVVDSQTVLDFVRADPVLSSTPVICYGQSIGGAVSISLAARNPDAIHALILENTFLSLPRLIPSAVPWLAPVAWLCHQKWDSANTILRIPKTTPMLFLSGTQDEIIPREHMISLWDIAIGKLNPDGTPKKQSSSADTSSSTSITSSTSKPGDGDGSEKNEEGSATSASKTESAPSPSPTPTNNNKAEGDEQEQEDEKEHVDYESVNGVEIMVSKRTKYRSWREFEGGKHNDTCVQPGYWASVWEFINLLVPLPAPA